MDDIKVAVAATAYVEALERYEEATAEFAGHAAMFNFIAQQEAYEELKLREAALRAAVKLRRARAASD